MREDVTTYVCDRCKRKEGGKPRYSGSEAFPDGWFILRRKTYWGEPDRLFCSEKCLKDFVAVWNFKDAVPR